MIIILNCLEHSQIGTNTKQSLRCVFVYSVDLVMVLFKDCDFPELKVCADIPIVIRYRVIRIPIADTCIRPVIPVAAE